MRPDQTKQNKVPADKPTIRDLTAGAAALAGHSAPDAAPRKVGPHLEGARLVLECQTSGGWPEPSLSWWRDNRLVDDSYEIVSAQTGAVIEERVVPSAHSADSDYSDGQVNAASTRGAATAAGADDQQDNSSSALLSAAPSAQTNYSALGSGARLIRNRLQLGPLSRTDLLANYTCEARNTRLGPAPTSSVVIDMNRKCLAVIFRPEQVLLAAQGSWLSKVWTRVLLEERLSVCPLQELAAAHQSISCRIE